MARQPEEKAEKEAEGLSDFLKKMAYLGAGTFFYTQENVSRIAQENLKIPRDVANGLTQQWDKNKRDMIDSVTGVVSSYLSSIDLIDLLKRAAEGMEVDIKIKVQYPGLAREDKPVAGSEEP